MHAGLLNALIFKFSTAFVHWLSSSAFDLSINERDKEIVKSVYQKKQNLCEKDYLFLFLRQFWSLCSNKIVRHGYFNLERDEGVKKILNII